ncbi:MAG: ArnT family glycosyltransferase [Thermoplasmatota archaeon]
MPQVAASLPPSGVGTRRGQAVSAPSSGWFSVEKPFLWLAGIFLLGLATRLFPLTQFAVWGSDSGEYFFLTQRLLSTGRIIFEYNGWGLAYPYFPGMFVIDGAVSLVTGADVLTSQRLVLPTLSALVPIIIYLIAREILPDGRVGILAAAFLAVTGPYVIIVSHPMPGTLGHLFLAGSILALLRAYEDPRWAWLLAPFGAALVLTHHLTLYFLVGIVAAIALVRELFRGEPDHRKLRIEAPYLVGLVVAAGYWWLVVAANFRDQIVGRVLDINPYLFAALCYIVLLGIPPLLIAGRRRFIPPATTHPHWPSPRFILWTAVALYIALLAVVTLFTLEPIPASETTIAPDAILYIIPPLFILSFAFAGGRVLRLVPSGALVSAWLIAVLGSLAFAIVTNSKVLFPFRHVEYFMDPLAIYGAAGIFAGIDYLARLRPRAMPVATAFIVVAILLGVASSQPPRETVAGFEEGTTAQELAAVQWAGTHLPPGAMVAADHRISSLMFGIAHRNATFDQAFETYHSDSLRKTFSEMSNLSTVEQPNARIDYVFLSPIIRQGVILVQWENSAPMSTAAQAKFDNQTFFTPRYGNPNDPSQVSIVEANWTAINAYMATVGSP